jgi:hypothetical protein
MGAPSTRSGHALPGGQPENPHNQDHSRNIDGAGGGTEISGRHQHQPVVHLVRHGLDMSITPVVHVPGRPEAAGGIHAENTRGLACDFGAPEQAEELPQWVNRIPWPTNNTGSWATSMLPRHPRCLTVWICLTFNASGVPSATQIT